MNARRKMKMETKGGVEVQMRKIQMNDQSQLSVLVCDRLQALGLKQSEFCRMTGFDQGLLSKIQSSIITNLSLESVLRLAVGLRIPPTRILSLIDRMDLHELVLTAYEAEGAGLNALEALASTRSVESNYSVPRLEAGSARF
jgi:transcriptional regulator with XRE-family HTH domain